MTLKDKNKRQETSKKIDATTNNVLVRHESASVKRIRDMSSEDATKLYEDLISRIQSISTHSR